MLCCAEPCQCVLQQPVANPYGRSMAPSKKRIAQDQQRRLDHTNPGPLPCLSFRRSLRETELSPQSCTLFADLVFQRCPGVATFSTLWSANRAFAIQSCALCRPLLQIEPWTRRNRDPLRGPWKPLYLRHNSVFTCEFTHGRTASPPNYLRMGGWHDDVGDMMVKMLTMTIVRSSEVS